MRIIAGAWRGRRLTSPPGATTSPTADRVRQALFDRLMHASWAGRDAVEGATVLDAFAGSGALGLEALSRGAAAAVFMERDRTALATLRANIAALRAEPRCTVLQADALRPPPGRACSLVFLDPPYGRGMIPRAAVALAQSGWLGPDTLVIAELARDDEPPPMPPLADFTHGAARILAWRGPL